MRSRISRKSKRLNIERLERRVVLAANVYISEFVAVNDATLADEDGDYPDWIEIFNEGPDDVDLHGWHLTDNAEDLRKWSFPSQSLSAGNFLIVYASDKERAVAGSPLHTNFKLTSNGEYLALTRDEGGSTVVVSEFSPEYPFQFGDISYGVGQTVDETILLESDAAGKYLLPQNDLLGKSWTTLNFNDSAWLAGTAGIGYQQTVPGFTVQDAKSTTTLRNLSNATAVLSGQNLASETIAVTPVVNFRDSQGGGGSGRFSGDAPFPNNSSSDDNDFAIRATGTIEIPTSGTWTFGINSDDGARLTIDGQVLINDDTLHAPRDTLGRRFLSAGSHDVELIFFERGGGAEVELWAANGSFTSYNNQFRLVGDLANGGLEVNTSATGTASSFGSLYQTDVGAMFDQSTDVYLRVPFTVSQPNALDSLTLRMQYDDGFVAYINGVEVARRNAPLGNVAANASATTDRSRADVGFVERIDISSFLNQLNVGINMLAIHGLNDAIDSDEFVIRAELAEVDVAPGERYYFPSPTPSQYNPATGVDGFLAHEVNFSQPHGFYSTSFQLALSAATQGASIRYTLDGSEPTVTNGRNYTGPITVSRTTTIRARAFKSGLEPSFVETRTYLFLSDVVTQTRSSTIAAGFPSSGTINDQSLDYGMDPDIVNSAVWGPQMMDALTQIPSMSVVMDVDDLLGSSNGIYVNARSHGKEWERPASLELLHPDGAEGFQVNAGIRVRGGFSRSGNNPKHAFRLFFRDEYGDAKLEYPLFGEEGTDEYDKVDLRTAQNYSWSFRGDGRNSFVRDVYSRDLQGALGNPYTRSRYYHLFINGQYWGLFQTQERAEARYAASYFGGNSDDYDVVKSAGSSGGYQNEATDGNLDAYRRLADFFYQAGGLGDANFEDYMRAQGMNPDGSLNPDFERLLDVENLMDYMLITYYTSDADGPGSKFTRPRVNNYFGIFNREEPDGFKFFEHDSEHSLDTGHAAGANYNMVSPLTTGGSQFRYFNPHWMHEQLANSNTEYRLKFMDRVTEQLFHDGLLTPDKAIEMIDARASQIDQAIIAESARWGDAKRSAPFNKNHWVDAVQRARDFFDGRNPILLDQLREHDWYPNTNPPEFLVNGTRQHGGDVDSTDKISIATSTSLEFDTTLIDPGSVWKYLDDGSNQGTAWRQPNFNDSSWDSGAAELGYGDGGVDTIIDYGSDNDDKHVTYYFRREFQVSNVQDVEALRLRLMRDDGAVVYLNGNEIARSNMPGGTINYQTSAAGVVSGSSESTFFAFEVDASQLLQGSNVLAVEIHQHFPVGGTVTSSDVSFDLELLAGRVIVANESQLYYTTDGSDPRLIGGGVSPAAKLFNSFTGIRLDATSEIMVRSFNGGTWGPVVAASFDVANSNGVPVAVDDVVNATEDTLAVGIVGLNDTLSSDGGNIFHLLSGASNGTAVLGVDGGFLYTPSANFHGTDSFSYRITDADGDKSDATVTINVAPVDDLPIAVIDTIFGTEDKQASGNLGTNDTLSGDGGNTFSIHTDPAHGNVVLASNGSFTYTPNANYHGADSFRYNLRDSDGDISTATVSVNVASVNDLPIAVADVMTTDQNVPLVGDVSGNDLLSGDGGDVFSLVSNGTHGNVSLQANGTFTYTPVPSFAGSDSFAYNLRDFNGDTSTATVTISVKSVDDEPVAIDDSFAATEDVVLSGSVATNDELSNNGGNVFSLSQNATRGSVSMSPDGAFSYTPAANYHGPDSFQYSLRDADGDTSTATVAISVAAVDDLPVAQADSVTATEDQLYSGNVSANDTLSGDGGNVFSLSQNATRGSVSMSSDGTFSYRPAANYHGSDSFQYSLRDADGDTSTATVAISVAAVDDLPVAQADSVTATEDQLYSGNVSANDTLSGDGGNVFSLSQNATHGSVSMSPNGAFSYIPATNYHGPDSFQYSLRDADGDTSTGTVTITVVAVSDLPVARPDAFNLNEDETLSGSVAANDTLSGDGGNVFSLAGAAAHGDVSVSPDGSFTYQPKANYHGPDSFRYRLRDADGDTSEAEVSVSVAPTNDLPSAVADSVSGTEDAMISGRVGDNDLLSGDGGNTFHLRTDALHGSVTVEPDGTFHYSPNPNYHGRDGFTYELRDLDGDVSTANVSINVASVNDIPSVMADEFSVLENSRLDGRVDANDELSGDGGNEYRLLREPAHGEVSVEGDGRFSYEPNFGFVGADSFTYELRDANGDARIALVTIEVIADPDGMEGDVDGNSQLNAADIDAMLAALRSGSRESRYDLNDDAKVDDEDLTYLIETVFGTKAGDADLDGDVDFADFLKLSANFGLTETSWSAGNFDQTPGTTFSDFLVLAINFGFNSEE